VKTSPIAPILWFVTIVSAIALTVNAMLPDTVKTEVRTVVTSTVPVREIALKIASRYPTNRWENVEITTNTLVSPVVYTVRAVKLESTSYE